MSTYSDAEKARQEKPVQFQLPAQVIVDCDPVTGEVVKVTILPAQSASDITLYALNGHDVDTMALAKRHVNAPYWAPLTGLPVDVVWEG